MFTDYLGPENNDCKAALEASKNGNIVKIRELAEQKGISISFISQSIGKSVGYLANVSSRNADVPTKYLPQIAKILGTSPAYLQGKTESDELDLPEVSSEVDYGTFQFDRFYDLCKKYGMKQARLYKMVGMPDKAGSNLRRTKNVKPEILEVWAKELHTTAAYLNGETDDPAETAAPAERPEKEKSPAADSREVTDDDIKFALFGGGDVTDAQFEEVKSFARFVKERDANGQTK
jgi:transcriptional regulator with XRE-family HTH domain